MSGPWAKEDDGAPAPFTRLIHLFLRKYKTPHIVSPNIPPGTYEVEFVFRSEDSTGVGMEMRIVRRLEKADEQSESREEQAP